MCGFENCMLRNHEDVEEMFRKYKDLSIITITFYDKHYDVRIADVEGGTMIPIVNVIEYIRII